MNMVGENKTDELFRQLRGRVDRMADGEAFPSVRQIMEEYQVSQATVTGGMRRLRELGLIESFIGRGTFVCRAAGTEPPKVLLLSNDWPSINIAEMIELIRAETERRGLRFEVRRFHFDENVCTRLNDLDADAVIIDGLSNDFLTPEQIMMINRSCVPVVISRVIVRVENICYVCGNNSEAGIVAANYLYQSGHRRFGVLFSEPHLFSVNEMVKSFSLCARTNRCEVELFDCGTQPGQSSIDNAYQYVLRNFRDRRPDISALFVVSDESAFGALRALRELGIAVPEELSVLGFGNVTLREFPLTSLDTPRREIARALLDIVEDRVAHRVPRFNHVEISPVVVERDTVKTFSHQLKEAVI